MLKKTAMITGAFGDIGKATAEKFAKNGYNLALTYLNTFDAEFISTLKSYGAEVLAMHCDQESESEIINFVNSAFKEFEYIDVLVTCAGKAEEPQMLIDRRTLEIDKVLNANLRGTILFNKEVLKYFLKQKSGNIVNISSIYGSTGGSLEAVYSACKAGIIGLTKSLAVEFAPYVRINAVAPGCIDTKMIKNLSKSDRECVISATPLERMGTPEDVANAIFFLASNESSYITGEVLQVSGGVVRY